MCGIAGFINMDRSSSHDELKSYVCAAAEILRHRGPDDCGIWIDEREGIALGHRRLSILDLSAAGQQPMRSRCGRYVIVFNGEVYNHSALRRELDFLSQPGGISWRGHSDTEVLLETCSRWGVTEAIAKLDGMFAFAIWDRTDRTLHLVRDRIGEKPLYYGFQGRLFAFGSELKVFHAFGLWHTEIDRNALALFFRHNCIPAPYSIYRGIYKLLPGTILTIPLHAGAPWADGMGVSPRPYWSIAAAVERGSEEPFEGTESEAIERLDQLLRTSIRHQMVADVPLGAFLSGGVDSSTVVALMQAQSSRQIKSFTAGFQEEDYNEAHFAQKVARHLGTDHTELYVTAGDALSAVPGIAEIYDEPYSDVSQIPTFLIARLTRRHVGVSLSGDGGDELFGGYNRYLWGDTLWRSASRIPGAARELVGRILTLPSPRAWAFLFRALNPALPKRVRLKNAGDKIQKMAQALVADNRIDLYRRLASHWTEPASVVIAAAEPPTVLTEPEKWASVSDFSSMMMQLDLMTYLPDDILVKVDRAAMSVGLETRLPFLDHHVVEFAWALPLSWKIQNGEGKRLLRKVLYRYVPRELIERPKTGFAVPLDSWLRGPLREWAEDLLDEKKMRQAGYLQTAPVRTKWGEHLSGKRNWQYHIWDVLLFNSWLYHQFKTAAGISDPVALTSVP